MVGHIFSIKRWAIALCGAAVMAAALPAAPAQAWDHGHSHGSVFFGFGGPIGYGYGYPYGYSYAPAYGYPYYPPPAYGYGPAPDPNQYAYGPDQSGGQGQSGGQSYCREFQTTIVVDGRPEKAHGTACLQPDGTWQVVN